jgi:hypothetical protein
VFNIKIVLCRIVPARYAEEAVVACHPINVTHPVMKLRKFLHDSGARIATQLYGNQQTYFDALYMSTY